MLFYFPSPLYVLMNISIVSLILSVIYVLVRRLFEKQRPGTEAKVISYKEQMQKLMASLSQASNQVDMILAEMSKAAEQREKAINKLEVRVVELSDQEKELKQKVENLEKIPLNAMDYFLSEIEKGEKSSKLRDYLLFIAGVISSIIVSIILKIFFGI